ncbi:MAG: hypothetical protein FJ279_33510, partial [Planctomycetes bacterium]|nr:hypothetical protein [Planctomycetota bacterium]
MLHAQPASLLTDPGFGHRSPTWRTLGSPRYEVVEGLGRAGGSCLRYQKPQGEAAANENSHHDQEVDVEPKTLYLA